MEINNPYISVEINESQFKSIKEQIRSELKKLGFEDIQDLPTPHISIAYLIGKKDINDLEGLAQEMIEAPFSMKTNGISLVDSSYYQGQIISLSLIHTDDFLYSQEHVKESLCNEEVVLKEDFPGGFKAHISLFLLKDIDDEMKELLPQYLEVALAGVATTITGLKFSVYNSDREKVLERKF